MRTAEAERPSWPELHEEIARLPAHYREPLVLCYFEGLSTEAAALRIGCPKGTLLSRLSRAREQLRRRLIRRGVAPAAVLTATAPAAEAMALPSTLRESTVKAALGFAGRDAANAAVASAAATTLAREILLTMSLSKLKLVGVSVLVSLLTIGGAQGLAYPFEGGGQDEPEKAVPAENRLTEAELRVAQAALSRAVDRLQRELDAARLRNDDLNRQLTQLRRALNALKSESTGVGVGTPPAAKTKEVETARDLDELTRRNEELKSQYLQSQRELRAAKGASPAKQQLSPLRKGGNRGGVAPGAMSPGFGAVFGVPNDPNAPISMNWGRLMIVMSPERDKLVSFNPVTKEASSFSTAGTKVAGSSQLVPIMGADVVAVMVKAPQITRIAAARQADGIWHVQDLREPVSGQATPIVGSSVAVYKLGRYLYAFSSLKGKWGVLKLPEGVDGLPSVSAHAARVEAGGHIYTFSVESAEWSDLDLNAVLNSPDDEDPKKASSPK
jgi:hypothetical protein